VLCAQFQQTLPVLIRFPTSMSSQAGWPGLVISANSDVEIAEQKELFLTGEPLYDGLQLIVELVLGLLGGLERGDVGTNEGDRSIGCLEAYCENSLCSTLARFSQQQECVSDSETDAVLTDFLWALSLPERSKIPLAQDPESAI